MKSNGKESMSKQPGVFLKYKFLPDFKTKEHARDILFIAYTGNSMNPTLREPELLEIRHYAGKPIRRGDVIYFMHEGIAIVHRVIEITSQYVETRGDNNLSIDSWMLSRGQITGRVMASWTGQKRRVIWGGCQGYLLGQALHGLYRLNSRITRLFSPVYRRLCESGFFSNFLPQRIRPRVIHFEIGGETQLFLVWGRIMIGRYADVSRQWVIRRPFRLIVNERLLLLYK